MILSGTVEIFKKLYGFTRIENDNKLAWYIYNTKRVVDGTEFALDIYSLEHFCVENLEPFLVSASEISLTDYKVFGNLYFINTINKAFSKCINGNFTEPVENVYTEGNLNLDEIYCFSGSQGDIGIDYKKLTSKSVVRKNKEIAYDTEGNMKTRTVKTGLFTDLNFNTGDVKLTTLYSSKANFNKRKEFKIEWENFDNLTQTEVKFKEYNLSLKAKTLSQLRMTRDFSWYYDSNGKPKKDYVVVDTLDKLKYWCTEVFPSIEFWATDVETTGVGLYESDNTEDMDHIVSLMVAWKGDHALFFPFDMEYMKNLPEEAWEMLKPWLEKIPCGGHNIGFDARSIYVKDGEHLPETDGLVDMDEKVLSDGNHKLGHTAHQLAKLGIELNILHDTQILNFNINTYRAKFNNSLKYLEHKYLKIDTLELKDIFGTSKLAGLFRYLPRELALIYACPDVEQWLPLFDILYDMLPVGCRKAYRLDMRTLKHIYVADGVGTRIDTLKAMQLRELNNKDREDLGELIYRYVGQAIAQKNYIEELTYESNNNNLTDEEIKKLLVDFFTSDRYLNAREEFNISSGPKLADIMYSKLGYPVLARSRETNQPAVNAGALKELLKEKVKVAEGEGWLKKDIPTAMSEVDKNADPIITADEFNSHAYPLPLLIAEYRLRDKRDSTFFKAIIDKAIGGVYYTQSKMAGAETYRIINTIQVLQGIMKKLCIPRYVGWYMLVFDFSQIEYRHMGGLAGVKSLIKNLNRFRADFHIECCALLHNMKTWLVTKALRSAAKSINFAIPYGMGIFSIAMSLLKRTDELAIVEATKQYNKWLEIFHEIKDLLDKYRKAAIENGYVENELGRRRWFFNNEGDETVEVWRKSLTKGRKKAIERAAGNYPIQSGAADLFKIAFCRFRDRLKKEGLSKHVKTSALVHDEIQSSVHPDVNPYFLYKIIWEECMLQIKGHPRYFAGVSIVDNWYEGKEDLYEAPIAFVDYIIKSGKADEKFHHYDDPKNQVLNDIREYMTTVFIKEFKEAGVDCESNLIDVNILLVKLEDYFLRGKLPLYFKPTVKPDKNYENDAFIRGLESFVLSLNKFEEVEFIYPDDYKFGKRAFVSQNCRRFVDETDCTVAEEQRNKVDHASELDSLDLGFNDGLDLDLDMDTLGVLDMLEQEEYESGVGDDYFGGPIYFCYSTNGNDSNQSTSDKIDINNMSNSEYIGRYGTEENKISVEAFRIVFKVSDLNDDEKHTLIDYCNSIAISEDAVGAREVVFKIGITYLSTGCYIGDYDLNKLKELVGENTVC